MLCGLYRHLRLSSPPNYREREGSVHPPYFRADVPKALFRLESRRFSHNYHKNQ